jgi:hypothetical protein
MIVWYASGPTEIANLQTPLFELTLDDFISEHCDLRSVWAEPEAQLAFIDIRYCAGNASHFIDGAMHF